MRRGGRPVRHFPARPALRGPSGPAGEGRRRPRPGGGPGQAAGTLPFPGFFGGKPVWRRARTSLGRRVRRGPGGRRQPPPGGGVVRGGDPPPAAGGELPLPGYRRVRPAAGRIRGAGGERLRPVRGAGVPVRHGGRSGKAGAGPGDLRPGRCRVGLPL